MPILNCGDREYGLCFGGQDSANQPSQTLGLDQSQVIFKLTPFRGIIAEADGTICLAMSIDVWHTLVTHRHLASISQAWPKEIRLLLPIAASFVSFMPRHLFNLPMQNNNELSTIETAILT